jgi:hypothetical protein
MWKHSPRLVRISSRSFRLAPIGITAIRFLNLLDRLDQNINPAGLCANERRSSTCLVRNNVVFPKHVINAYMGSGGIHPLIRNLSTAWRWVVSLTAVLPPAERPPPPPPVLIEQEAGWVPEPIRTPEPPAHRVVIISITLSRLPFIRNTTVYYGVGENFIASVASIPNPRPLFWLYFHFTLILSSLHMQVFQCC